jgi:DNA-binding response OmpR family regulator
MEETKVMRRVFLVEDDVELAEVLAKYLENARYETTVFHRGDLALEAIVGTPPDLVVLDIMLPGLDGLEILREIRSRGDSLVLFISAKGSEIDQVLGLELGADDYLVKPFSAREMVARVKALFRRAERESGALEITRSEVLEIGGLSLDLERKTIFSKDKEMTLTSSEYCILLRMMRAPGKTFSRQDLSDCLDRENLHGSRAVDVHVRNLRKKVAELGPVCPLQSVRGVGYRVDTPRVRGTS